MSRTLAVVAAHPDDDTYSVGGSVALHADDPDLRFVVVHATDGEAGQIAAGSGATRRTLAAVRRQEARRSWEVLGRVPDRHEWLGYPDGGVADVPFEELVGRVATILAGERPDVVCTLGPDGVTGHPDHIAVSQATTAAFLRFAGDGRPGFRRLAHGVLARSALDAWNGRRTAAGLTPWNPDTLYHPRAVPDERVDVVVDTAAVAPRVRAALLAHRTQWDDFNPPGVSDEDSVSNLAQETWVVAWPEPRPPRTLRDLFEGL